MDLKFSIIIPVFNRPEEVDDLLESLGKQTAGNFEVIVIDDGSQKKCQSVTEKYADRLNIRYFYKENSGPGQTRNFGAQCSHGDYLLILDSDCMAPTCYLEEIALELHKNPCDAFGGPDKAHETFSDMQKAISYAMTSFFTTGGIRGGKRKLDKFYPRSFNMGIRKSTFEALGGFSEMRFGEDIDLSIRIFENGYSCRLFPDAWVFHKRRTDLKKFFRQVHNSGIARINLYKRHPKSLKMVHFLPACFTLATATVLAGSIFYPWLLLFPLFYASLVFTDSSMQNKSLRVGILSLAAAFVQLIGYGTGFLRGFWKRIIRKKPEFRAFEKNFYK